MCEILKIYNPKNFSKDLGFSALLSVYGATIWYWNRRSVQPTGQSGRCMTVKWTKRWGLMAGHMRLTGITSLYSIAQQRSKNSFSSSVWHLRSSRSAGCGVTITSLDWGMVKTVTSQNGDMILISWCGRLLDVRLYPWWFGSGITYNILGRLVRLPTVLFVAILSWAVASQISNQHKSFVSFLKIKIKTTKTVQFNLTMNM